ncbi:unnamed protein product [Caenorhabditis bovis]|uniref:F-box domain-containing protein n=1 Tax=Caenorhabditis bovis TaxID=2654633 RepID=A0A8S1EU38_9PELO|nr:unnamed protein product [Caenorhabditis bovis]
MEVQRKRSFNTKITNHDFRKEYKGSALERKFSNEKPVGALRAIAEWISRKATTTTRKTKIAIRDEPSRFDTIPNEIVFAILKNVNADQTTMRACRRVSKRFEACVNAVATVDVNVLSRLVITGLAKKGIEMRWVSYVGQKSNATTVSWPVIRSGADFAFSFKRFSIQRIILKDLLLSDEIIDFLRRQLQFSDLTKLIQLSLKNVDFSAANSLTLHKLLAPMAKTLEIFEVCQPIGMRPDSVTDHHLAQLDAMTIRRISIDGVKFAGGASRQLKIGDASLKRFAELGAFPTMVLDRCAVTTQVVCDYTKNWFDQCNESEKQVRSQVCTVKRCPKVKGSQFEAECRRRGLRCKNRRGSGSLTLYNVQEENTKREFTIALAALEDKTEKLKQCADLCV